MTPKTTEPPNIADTVKALKADITNLNFYIAHAKPDIETIKAYILSGGGSNCAHAMNAADRIRETVRDLVRKSAS